AERSHAATINTNVTGSPLTGSEASTRTSSPMMTGMKSVSNSHHVPSDSFDHRFEPVLRAIFRGRWDELAKLGARPRSYSMRRQSPEPRLQPISFKSLT